MIDVLIYITVLLVVVTTARIVAAWHYGTFSDLPDLFGRAARDPGAADRGARAADSPPAGAGPSSPKTPGALGAVTSQCSADGAGFDN